MPETETHYCAYCGAELVRRPKERPVELRERRYCDRTCANRDMNAKRRRIKKCGIYEIRNNLDGKVYIGSSLDIRDRFYKHRKLLRRGKHNSAHLQAAWNKYGPQAFSFSIVEFVDCSEHLIAKEQEWLDRTHCTDNRYGYNNSPTAGNSLGVRHTQETKLRMSAASKGRNLGSNHHLTHLREEDALQIRQQFADGATQASIANHFRISVATVRSICSGETWQHVGGPLRSSASERNALLPRVPTQIQTIIPCSLRHHNSGHAKLTESDVLAIKELLASGKSGQEIARQFNVDRSTISNIRCGHSWTHVAGRQTTPGIFGRIDLYRVIGSARTAAKLTEVDVTDIKRRLRDGEGVTVISRIYGVAPATISLIRAGRNWSHVPWPD